MGAVSQATPSRMNVMPVDKADVIITEQLENGSLVMFLHTTDGRILMRKRSYTKAARVSEVVKLIRRFRETCTTDWIEIHR